MYFKLCLGLVLMVVVPYRVWGQIFKDVSGGMQYNPQCGIEENMDSWKLRIRMVLPYENIRHYKQYVDAYTNNRHVCSIDISSCGSMENETLTSDICWCGRQSGYNYDLYVKQTAILADSEQPLTMSIPWLHECFPQELKRVMTQVVPPIYSDRTDISATITVDDGVTQPLSEFQMISVCNDHYVDLTVCVYNLLMPYHVTLTCAALHETWVADTECIKVTKRFDFRSHATYNLSLTYGESTWCPRDGQYDLVFEETSLECPKEPCDDVEEPEVCESKDDSNGLLPRYTAHIGEDTHVMCDSETDGGGWIVMLRRAVGDVDFENGTFQSYKLGFGAITADHWLGLEITHEHCFMTHNQDSGVNLAPCELRIDMEWNGLPYWAHYSNFWLEGGAGFYTIHVTGYSGDAGDSLTYHDGMPFTTHDQDHDMNGGNCAKHNKGGWWYRNCHNSNLCGMWGSTDYGTGLVWGSLTGMTTSLSFVEMKFRVPVNSTETE